MTFTHSPATIAQLTALSAQIDTLGRAASAAGRQGVPFDHSALDALRREYRALDAPRVAAHQAAYVARCAEYLAQREWGVQLTDGHAYSDIYAVAMIVEIRPGYFVERTITRNVHGASAAAVLAAWPLPDRDRVSAVYPDRCG